MASAVPSTLLLRYFEIAQRRLRRLADDLGEMASLPSDANLSWHRSRIVAAQLTSLDDAIHEWQRRKDINNGVSSVNSDAVQSVLRQIGVGDFSYVSFVHDEDYTLPSTAAPSTGLRSRSSASRGIGDDGVGFQIDHGQEQQLALAGAVEQTNDLARLEFARSVLTLEWRLECSDSSRRLPQSERESRSNGDGIDGGSILEYCGLMMAAVRLPEVQKYLQSGAAEFILSPHKAGDFSEKGVDNSVEDRLLHIQKLIWNALGCEATHAKRDIDNLLAGESDGSLHFEDKAKAMETLTKYTSVMTVAATNAAMSSVGDDGNQSNDDGTTRVVGVSYSEKIISLPTNGEGNITSQSLSAPASNTIDEHKLSQERQQLDVAQKTSLLQQQLWSEFGSLSSNEQAKTLEKAKMAHEEFMDKVMNTPPGKDRVLLMQNMDAEVQKLLVIYKLWCSQ